jgi:uncharacterized protein (TIGR03663 family)
VNRWTAIALLVITLGALAFRLPQLGGRPLHNDEAVNATKLAGLWEKHQYAYDPNEYHGPTLYYLSLPFLWLGPAKNSQQLTDGQLRLAPVFFGASLILLIWLLADGLGKAATIVAGLFTAISPAMVFYSRYFIHEMLLVFFSLLFLASVWRYSRNRHWGWVVTAGAAMGLMYATKETFVLAVAAIWGAVIMTWCWSRWQSPLPWQLKPWWNTRHVLLGLVVALMVAELFFTSFFTNSKGPLDAIRTYLPWTNRAGGQSPHIHPWNYYFEHLFWFFPPKKQGWSEGLVLGLALVGAGTALFRREWPGINLNLARFLVFYTGLLTGVYCVIGYKTPWCFLGFYHGMILLAGLGVTAILSCAWPHLLKTGILLVLLLPLGHLAYQSYQINYLKAADRWNPYVYSQTMPDIHRLIERVEGVARAHPQGTNMLIKVMSQESFWPLPWYLRQFTQVGWWEQMPSDPYAPVVIVNTKFNALLDDKSDKKYLMAGMFELRPKVFLELYVELELWKKYVETLPKDRD